MDNPVHADVVAGAEPDAPVTFTSQMQIHESSIHIRKPTATLPLSSSSSPETKSDAAVTRLNVNNHTPDVAATNSLTDQVNAFIVHCCASLSKLAPFLATETKKQIEALLSVTAQYVRENPVQTALIATAIIGSSTAALSIFATNGATTGAEPSTDAAPRL